MKNKILKLNFREPLPKDFDPLLGRSVSAYLRALRRAEVENKESMEIEKSSGSVFDDPDLDFSYQAGASNKIDEPNSLKEIAPLVQTIEPNEGIAEAAIIAAAADENLAENNQVKDEENILDDHQTQLEVGEPVTDDGPSYVEQGVIEEAPSNPEVLDVEIANSEQSTINEEVEEPIIPPPEFLKDEISIDEVTPSGEHYFGEENVISETEDYIPLSEGELSAEENQEQENQEQENQKQENQRIEIFEEPILGCKPKVQDEDEIGILADIGKNIAIDDGEKGVLAGLGKTAIDMGDEIGILAKSKLPPRVIDEDDGFMANIGKAPQITDEIGPLATSKQIISDESIFEENAEKQVVEPIAVDNNLHAIEETSQADLISHEDVILDESVDKIVEVAPEASNDEIVEITETTEIKDIVKDEFAPLETSIDENIEAKFKPVDEAADVSPVKETVENPVIEEIAKSSPNNQLRKAASGKKSRKKRKKKQSMLFASAYFLGTFFTGASALLLLFTMLAPIGRPFDDQFAPFAIVWFFTSLVAIASWAVVRSLAGGVVAALLAIIYLIIIVPNIGVAPKGGNANRITIGWANIEGSAKSLSEVLKQAKENDASIIMLAGANGLQAAPQGWALIEAPNKGDATALAVLSNENWRAVTLPGEPTMARPVDGSMTVIGVNPIDSSASKRQSPEREALINRTANRTGIEDIPVLAVGDFAAPAWDRQMKFFTRTAQVKRIRCGGFIGTTQSKGLFGVSFDHAFSRGLNVQKCKIGSRLPHGGHSPLWISVEGKGGK